MKKRIYHGSILCIERPQILPSSRTLDFGEGFYTTTSYEQAVQWTKRKISAQVPRGYVSCYEVDLAELKRLNYLAFSSADEAWLDFVMRNRTEAHYRHEYDAVYGPVANDRVYAAFGLYESGVFNKQDLIRELRTFTLVDQLLFHTARALETLHFIEAKEVESWT